MTRIPEDRREVRPSRRVTDRRPGASFGSRLNVSVPISFGLPLIVVGLFLIITAAASGRSLLWILGGVSAGAGVLLFASGKRL
jgi:hypothetical protein